MAGGGDNSGMPRDPALWLLERGFREGVEEDDREEDDWEAPSGCAAVDKDGEDAVVCNVGTDGGASVNP